jgi:membrane peptidoglycan carboxypeptidase
MLKLLLAVVGLVLVALIAGTVYLLTLPSVDDAQQRTRQLMAAHHEGTAMPVPAKLAAAVISTEDEHFDENVVFNVATGIGRAGVDVLSGGSNPGGATIDQQLAKQLYGGGTLQEIGLGIKLGLHYSHRVLLAMYLNVDYYGNGFWGVRQAAAGYFGTTPARLTWAEAAMLAGLLQAPTVYDPLHHRALAKMRQQHVLDQLAANHRLTAAQAAVTYRAPLPLRFDAPVAPRPTRTSTATPRGGSPTCSSGTPSEFSSGSPCTHPSADENLDNAMTHTHFPPTSQAGHWSSGFWLAAVARQWR